MEQAINCLNDLATVPASVRADYRMVLLQYQLLSQDAQAQFRRAIAAAPAVPAPVRPVVAPPAAAVHPAIPADVVEGAVEDILTVVGFSFWSSKPSDIDSKTIELVRDPENPHDSNAIAVYTVEPDGKRRQRGFVARADNLRLVGKTIDSVRFHCTSGAKAANIRVVYH